MRNTTRFGTLASLLVPILLAPEAHARWATPDDAIAAMDFDNAQIEVSKDGTYAITAEEQIEILKEQARRGYGSKRLYYNSRAQDFKLLEAQIINGGKTSDVESRFIEDKPVASNANGFDQINQVMVAFPDVTVGSKTRVKYRRKVHEIPFKGFFSQWVYFDNAMLVRKGALDVVSELPLFLESHDPQKALEISQTQDDGKYRVRITLKKPLFESIMDEDRPSYLASERTWVVLSSSKRYSDMAASVLPKYEEILGAELPAPFQDIVSQARDKETAADKINAVTSALAKRMRYMGDWRPVAGGHVPRPLALIAETRFGDCKDFATSTTAMLRKLGIEATVAWVNRGDEADPLPSLPIEAFNHAIVHAKAEGKTFWIDPTNFQSFAQGVFPDIIDRQALVLEHGNPHLETIPAGKPSESIYRENYTLQFEPNGDSRIDLQQRTSGRSSISMTGASLRYSKETLDHLLATTVATESHIKSEKIDGFDLSSTIVSDLSYGIHLVTRNSYSKTSAGLAYALPEPGFVPTLMDLETQKRVSNYFIGQPHRFEREYRIANIKVVGDRLKGCALHSPWVDVARSLKRTSDGLVIKESYEIKTPKILNSDLKSEEFGELQSRMRDCFDRVAVVFETLKGHGVRLPASRKP